jgi:hypothetical protein
MSDNLDSYKFWTFLPQSITIRAVDQNGSLAQEAVVTGWFAFSRVSKTQPVPGVSGYEPSIETDVIHDTDKPVTIRLRGSEYFKNKAVDEISAKDVVAALQELFRTPFNDIPTAPKEVNTRVPPSKRKK